MVNVSMKQSGGKRRVSSKVWEMGKVFHNFFFFWSCCMACRTLVPSSVQFSRLVLSDSLQNHWLQNTRLPCPSPTPGACSNSCPSSRWCHPTISSSVVPFSSSHLQSFPASGSFHMNQFFESGGQSTGVSASASVLPMNIQDWFPLGWTGWISLLSKTLSRVFSNTTVQKHQVPRPEIKPMPPVVEVLSLNHWISREVPSSASF